MDEARKESDKFMVAISRELGGIQSQLATLNSDRADVWAEIKAHALETRDSIEKMTVYLAIIQQSVSKIPEMSEKLSKDHSRITVLEEINKKNKWTLTGMLLGAGIAGGAGTNAVIQWFMKH